MVYLVQAFIYFNLNMPVKILQLKKDRQKIIRKALNSDMIKTHNTKKISNIFLT